MNVRYIDPLSRAIERSKEICFRPFDLGKWFVLGFACWVARITQGGGGGSYTYDVPFGDREAEGSAWLTPVAALEMPEVLGGALLAGLIGCAILFVFVVLPLLIWLSSRFEFIFLDDVVWNRAEIKAPWAEYKAEGNSLFLWRLGFIAVAVVVVCVALAPAIVYVVQHGDAAPPVVTILLLILPLLVVAIGLAYVDLFLRSFVVPIMYKERLKSTAAWSRFAPYLKEHLGSFLLYGLWLVGLMICLAFGLLVLIIVTCCIAGILLIIPYIGTVLLLPVYVALRALSLEFLAQFSDDFKIFPELEPPPAAAAAAAGGAPPPPEDPGPPPAFEPDVG